MQSHGHNSLETETKATVFVMGLHVNNLNEDEQLLISMHMYSNSAIAETEEGRSLECDCLLE